MIKSAKTYTKYRFLPKIGVSGYWFDYWTKIRYRCQQSRYTAPAHPKKIIYVNPQLVDKEVKGICKADGLGQIVGGTWKLVPIEDRAVVKGLIQRFEHGYDWEETELYNKAKKKFSKRNQYNGYKSFDEWKRVRLNYIEELYEDIENDGYKPNIRHGHRVPERGSRIESNKHNSEPWVAIGADGTIYWREGFHRYAIAHVVGIESIPVYVLARHEEWQSTRENINNASIEKLSSNKAELLDHPDLQNIK